MVIPKSSLQLLLSLFYLWLTLAIGPNVSAQTVKPYTFEEHHMGTLFKITLYAESDSVAELAASNAFQEIERLNNIMSDYLPESELNQFSQTSGSGKFVRLSEPLFEILSQAQWISYQTGGLFDVTVGAMSKAWRELRSQPVPVLPAPEDLDALIRRSGYRHLVLRHETQSGMLERPGMKLDLGGMAKGMPLQERLKPYSRSESPQLSLMRAGISRQGTLLPAGHPGVSPSQNLLLKQGISIW